MLSDDLHLFGVLQDYVRHRPLGYKQSNSATVLPQKCPVKTLTMLPNALYAHNNF